MWFDLKLAEMQKEEAQFAKRLKVRLDQLVALADTKTIDDPMYETWTRNRLKRYVADYLLRNGYHATAIQMIQRHNLQVNYKVHVTYLLF